MHRTPRRRGRFSGAMRCEFRPPEPQRLYGGIQPRARTTPSKLSFAGNQNRSSQKAPSALASPNSTIYCAEFRPIRLRLYLYFQLLQGAPTPVVARNALWFSTHKLSAGSISQSVILCKRNTSRFGLSVACVCAPLHTAVLRPRRAMAALPPQEDVERLIHASDNRDVETAGGWPEVLRQKALITWPRAIQPRARRLPACLAASASACQPRARPPAARVRLRRWRAPG